MENIKDRDAAIILAACLGWLGVDRFYLGYYGIGLFKMLTFGCVGILWVTDLIRIVLGTLKPKNGNYKSKSSSESSSALNALLQKGAEASGDTVLGEVFKSALNKRKD